MENIQIALVDDHRLFRSGIASLINNFKGFNILFEASNGQEMVRKISSKLKPDIVLLDIHMPVMDGAATALWLRENYPEIRIIVLSMLEDPEKVLTMLKFGTKGYLLKDSEPHEFEIALQKVSVGEVYYPEFVTRLLINSFNQNIDQVTLQIRELEFLKLAASELTYKEIATQMCISIRTVDGYRDQLFEKLGVKSRIGLVLYAIKNKLIEV
ncbi:MAG TPA: response regulator transcription factor [Mucilaginibacter sp.]